MNVPSTPSFWVMLRRALPFVGMAMLLAFILSVSMRSASSVAERGVYFATTLAFLGFLVTVSERRSALRASLFSARVGFIEKEIDAAFSVYIALRELLRAKSKFGSPEFAEALDAAEKTMDVYEAIAMRDVLFLGRRNAEATMAFRLEVNRILKAMPPHGEVDEKPEDLARVITLVGQMAIEARFLLNVDELHDATQKVVWNMPFDPMKEAWPASTDKHLRKRARGG